MNTEKIHAPIFFAVATQGWPANGFGLLQSGRELCGIGACLGWDGASEFSFSTKRSENI